MEAFFGTATSYITAGSPGACAMLLVALWWQTREVARERALREKDRIVARDEAIQRGKVFEQIVVVLTRIEAIVSRLR